MKLQQLAVLMVSTFLGCSGGGAGSLPLQPLPAGERFSGTKVDHAVSLHLSDAVFSKLNSNWDALLAQVAPNRKLELPVSCSIQNIPNLGNFAIADQGAAGCTSESCGRMDGQCDALDEPAVVQVEFGTLDVKPLSSDMLAVSVEAFIDTGKIMIDSVSRRHAVCLFQNPVKCSLDLDTALVGARTNLLQVNLQFLVDTRWDKVVSLNVSSVEGTQLCGLPGSPAAPKCLENDDLVIAPEGSCSAACRFVGWDVLTGTAIALFGNQLKTAIQSALDGVSCQTCGPNGECPQNGAVTSTCDTQANRCLDTGTQRCVPKVLGLENRLTLGEANPMDLSLGLGGYVQSVPGLALGLRGGSQATSTAACAPQAPPFSVLPSTAPNFTKLAQKPYDLAFSLSGQFLNQLLYSTQQSGGMCAQLSTYDVSLIESGLFTPLLPSLRLLTTKSNESVPMVLRFRPQNPPTLQIGSGSVDPQTKKIVDPLLLVEAKDLDIDFYALIEERQLRLFTLSMSLQVPFGVELDSCSQLTPVLGDLSQMITSVKAINSEILAEDLGVLEKLVKNFISLAEPALASNLTSFALPKVGNFQVSLNELKGVTPIPGTSKFEHLAVFAEIGNAPPSCASASPSTQVKLLSSSLPSADEMKTSETTAPQALVQVAAWPHRGELEASFRVNGGFWSPFRPLERGLLRVSHPSFIFQKHHRIEVRTRSKAKPEPISAPAAVDLVVDLEPPTLSITEDAANDRLVLSAYDFITPREKLRFSYQWGEGEWTAFGQEPSLPWSSLQSHGRLRIRVQDEAGHVGEATYAVPRVVGHPEDSSLEATHRTQGCTSTSGSAMGLVAGIWLVRRRRTSPKSE